MVSLVCRTWHGSPSKPQIPSPSAHSSIHTNCRHMKCRAGQRKAIESRLCIQPDIIVDLTKAPLCSWATGDMGMSSGIKSELQQSVTSGAIPMLLLCAPGCCYFCLCSKIRKATSTCSEITLLLISCSSTVLYICFLASKCLCFWDRKVVHDFCIKAAYCFQAKTRVFGFNL